MDTTTYTDDMIQYILALSDSAKAYLWKVNPVPLTCRFVQLYAAQANGILEMLEQFKSSSRTKII